MTDMFDGDAISRKDRDFLKSLSDHPLAHNPLYSMPCPPSNDNEPEQAFAAALDWMLINYDYYAGAFMGKGGIISLVDGKMTTIASQRGLMQPYAIERIGPLGGIKLVSVVDAWMRHPLRAHIDAVQTRSDKPRPTYEENGETIFNRYWPPAHPMSGGEIETFKIFFARLFPDEKEREWFWNYLVHKARKPWIPMVAVIMVAEEFGSGRGTLFDILELVFGEDYVAPCTFVRGEGAARLRAALGDVRAHRDQSPRRHKAAAWRPALLRPHLRAQDDGKGDGRDSSLDGDPRKYRRALQGAPRNGSSAAGQFDPYGEPPPFEGRLKMIGMGETRLEDAYGAAIDALEGFPLFTMTQALRVIGYFGDYKTGDWPDKARHTVAKNAYRLRERSEPNNRIKYLKRDEIIYARTKADQQRWHPAETKFIVEQLDQTEKMIVRRINTGQIDIIARLEELQRKREEEDED
jgi:hypothetical protein